jgi:hypothetical protein
MTNIHPVLALRPMCLPLRRHRSMDRLCGPDIARNSTPALLHHAAIAIRTNHSLPRACAKLATASDLFLRLDNRLQCLHARRCSPVLADRRIRSRNSCMDCCRILVLLVDIR